MPNTPAINAFTQGFPPSCAIPTGPASAVTPNPSAQNSTTMPERKHQRLHDPAALVQEERNRDRDHRENARREDRREAESERGERERRQTLSETQRAPASVDGELRASDRSSCARFHFGVSRRNFEFLDSRRKRGRRQLERGRLRPRIQALLVVAGSIPDLRGQLHRSGGIFLERRRDPELSLIRVRLNHFLEVRVHRPNPRRLVHRVGIEGGVVRQA